MSLPETVPATHRNVMAGLDGWLFLCNDTNDVMGQMEGRFSLPDDFQDRWRRLFEYRSMRLAELTDRYFFGIIPNKACVYSQFLPPEIVPAQRRPVHDILDAASGRIGHRYFLDTLIAASLEFQTFCKGDTHWNHRGALCAFNALMRELSLPELTEADIAFEQRIIPGDLTEKIGQTTETQLSRFLHPRFRVVEDNAVNNVGKLVITENDDKSLPTLVLFRDSFGSAQMQMFASRFSRVVAVWQPNVDYGIVAREKPNFVISQQVERFLVSVPDDAAGPTNAEYVARKRPGT